MSRPPPRSLKLVLVGNHHTGKSTFVEELFFSRPLAPGRGETVLDMYRCDVDASDPDELILWDTGGVEDNDRLRPLSYARSDAFLMFVSYSGDAEHDRESRDAVRYAWGGSCRVQSPDASLFIVVNSPAEFDNSALLEPESAEARELEALQKSVRAAGKLSERPNFFVVGGQHGVAPKTAVAAVVRQCLAGPHSNSGTLSRVFGRRKKKGAPPALPEGSLQLGEVDHHVSLRFEARDGGPLPFNGEEGVYRVFGVPREWFLPGSKEMPKGWQELDEPPRHTNGEMVKAARPR
jgi:Ras of Complex, Roc, domain of DAPkinase